MTHLVLTGATGLVGSCVLDAMLSTPSISKITILSRRPVKMAEDRGDPRVNVILHKDFNDYSDPSLLAQLKSARGCIWALGISQNEVSEEEYVKITKDFAASAATAFSNIAKERNESIDFVFVSGGGATFQPGMMTPRFGRVKGETELVLAEIRKQNPLLRVSSVRPQFVDAAEHNAIKPYIPQAMWKRITIGAFGPAVRRFAKGICSPTEPLGRFLVDMSMRKFDAEIAKGAETGVEMVGEMPVIENSAIRRWMKLDEK